MGKGKKGKKQDDDWENDLDEIAKEAGIDLDKDRDEVEIVHVSKEKKKKKKGKELSVEDSEDLDTPVQNSKKPSFSALMMDDDEDDNDSDNSPDELKETVQVTNQKKKKGKKKKQNADDDDLADILADIELTDKKEPVVSKKSKKKKKKDVEDEIDEIDENYENDVEEHKQETVVKANDSSLNKKVENDEDGDNDIAVVKTAAQKRAEKKERDKKKKEAEKKKTAKKKKKESEQGDEEKETEAGDSKTELIEDTSGPKQLVEPSTEAEKEGEGVEPVKSTEAADGSSDEDGDDKAEAKEKKKKKKKKKKDDEDKSKKTKKPGKSAILKMQEALEEVKREEERLRAEAEAKEKALEEAENQRLEKLRLEQERKDKKKQKEKERKDRLKKEGKLLTPAQKEQKRKAEAMLEAMKQQGIIVPTREAGEKPKKVQYGKKKKQPTKQVSETPSVEESKEEESKIDKVKEEVKYESAAPDAWDNDDEDTAPAWDKDEAVADSWDADKDVPKSKKKEVQVSEPEKKAESEKLKKQLSTKSQSEADEDDEEEEEGSSEEESESDDEESSSEEETSSDEEDKKMTPEKIKERVRERIQKRKQENEAKRSVDELRAPVICVLGHVDTGKTKILDKIRRTNVQDGEAGGITQQIGATNIPVEKIREQTKMVKEFQEFNLKLPGLLVIDTPGHESFSNLRSRGSNLCDMAILVVDIMHGLEPQTIESINLLKKKQTPFVVALNKIDRIFEWKKTPQVQVEDTVKKQKKSTKQDFDERSNLIIGQFAEQGLNAALHYQNPDEKSYISLVPTSAHSGDGMGDLMAIICTLTQTRLAKKLAYSEELESTVMEVKALPGLGTTIDVILVNGKLKEGDTLITGGFDGAIVTQIRSVLTPQPMRELRVKAQYIHHQVLKAAQGAKICGKDLDKVLAGSPVYVAQYPDEVEYLKEEVEDFVSSSLKAIKVSDRGVYVQASTLGSLEALLEFLKTSKIPYCGVNIGPVHKKDVMRCSVMLEHEPMYAVVLAFDVKIERDAQEYADKEGIKIFSAEIIYHLFDQFTAYCEEYKEKKREQYKHLAVYPCKLRILPQHIFNTRDPIVVGVNVEAGTVRLGTPIVVPSQNRVMIGFVTGLEANHKQLEKVSSGTEVCVKIDSVPGEAPKLYGRHFTHEDVLVSRVTRESIDVMKQYFREDMQRSDWQLVVELKKLLDIM